MKASALSLEIRNAIVWLERQPGVTSVVQQRYQRTKHHQKVGSAKIDGSDNKHVRIRVYDKLGTKLLFVYATPDMNRAKWMAQVANNDIAVPTLVKPIIPIIDKKGVPKERVRPVAKLHTEITSHVERPHAVNASAAQVYDVTPEIAAKWLERNTRNRTLRMSVINRYAADMKAGRWQISPDAIGFDTAGTCVNGQHRLWAVFESGCTVQMMVAFDLAPGVVAVLDDHLKRNLGDIAKIRKPGTTVTTIHTSVAKMLLTTTIMSTAIERHAALERVTRQDQLSSLDRHWDAIEFAFRECFRSRKMRSIVVTPVVTPIARAFYTQDLNRLREFGNVMLTGMMETSEDKPAVLLRNYLLKLAMGSLKANQDTIYKKAERALQAFLKRERVGILYEAASELFVLPEETVAGTRASRRR